MRALTPILFLTMLGCANCPDRIDLSSPRNTIESFHRAFSCDAKALEFRCFSDEVKESFHGLPGYSIGRQVFRNENRTRVLLLKVSDLKDRISIRQAPDGNHALASIRIPGGVMDVELVNEPEYWLFHPDATVTHDFATAVTAHNGPRGVVTVVLHDGDLTGSKPIQRVTIQPRWVIAALPGLDEALSRSGIAHQ